MPIRASERHRYPTDWHAISARIRERSGGRCECHGECGLHQPNPQPRRCEERHGEPARWAKGLVILTVAHLGDPSPENCADDNLKAMCQRCHLRYDQPQHQANAAVTRRAQKQNRELFEAPHDANADTGSVGCGNRACVNPWHLEAVTLAENLRRRKANRCAICTESAARNMRFLQHAINDVSMRPLPQDSQRTEQGQAAINGVESWNADHARER